MKTKLSTKAFLGLAVAVAFLIPSATRAASKVTFDNQSGTPARVKLVGPTASSVTVANSKKESLTVAPGHYFIKVRYGTPGAYTYSKGDEFDVKETATTAADITITLHKVVAGNYGSKAISEAEFETSAVTAHENKKEDKEVWREGETKFCALVGMPELPNTLDSAAVRAGGAIAFIFKPNSAPKFKHPKTLEEIEKTCGKPSKSYDEGAKGKTYYYGRVGYTTIDGKTITEVTAVYSISSLK